MAMTSGGTARRPVRRGMVRDHQPPVERPRCATGRRGRSPPHSSRLSRASGRALPARLEFDRVGRDRHDSAGGELVRSQERPRSSRRPPSRYSASVSTTTRSPWAIVRNRRKVVVTSDNPSRVDSHAALTASAPSNGEAPTRSQCTSSARNGYASTNRCPTDSFGNLDLGHFGPSCGLLQSVTHHIMRRPRRWRRPGPADQHGR